MTESKAVLRRQFLGVLGAAAPLGARPAYRPKLAGQVYVWTQVLAARKTPLIEGIPEIFESSRKAGFKRMEVMSIFLTKETLPVTSRQIRKLGIEVPIVYHGVPLHDSATVDRSVAEILATAEAAKSVGASIIEGNPNPKPGRKPKTDAELEVQARAVNRIADALAARGQHLILHHHDPEMADNAREWRHLLRNTDPKKVGFCMDFDWVIQAGQDPFALLKEAGPRVESFHLRNARGRVWTQSVDEGDYDYPRLAAFLREHGFTGFLVVELAHRKETAITRPLGENLRLSRAYVEKTFKVR